MNTTALNAERAPASDPGDITLHRESYTIRSYEVDVHGVVSIPAICNYFQNLGYNHALRMKEWNDIEESGSTGYVLTRLHVRMLRIPRWKETITIASWLSPIVSGSAIRDFELTDERGSLVGVGTNSAVFFDLERRRPMEAPEGFLKLNLPKRPRALDDPFERLPKPAHIHHEKAFTAGMTDIDMYNHVNNVVYISWAMDAVPQEVWRTHVPMEMEIAFRSEVSFGEAVVSQAEEIRTPEGMTYVHRLARENSERDVALLRTRWFTR